jgi:hypothetical protein
MPRTVSARKVRARKAAQKAAGLRRLERWRRIAAVAGFVPLGASIVCGVAAVPGLCAIPREWYLGLWSAAFGSFIGLTIRLYLERRRAARET